MLGILAVTALGAAKLTAIILGSVIGALLLICLLFFLWAKICEHCFEGLASLAVFYYGILSVIIGAGIFGLVWLIVMVVG